ncbi:MAG: hypothetical protein KW793_03305 [Candidatus Doudnabacteria bacterium]|nr:hypothetical protein [Candidatus Doudnabacteria bacterium]
MEWRYTLASTMRIVLFTLNIVLLVVILIESYINNNWDTVRILMIIVSAINILYFTGNKPKAPEIKLDANTQSIRETPQGN